MHLDITSLIKLRLSSSQRRMKYIYDSRPRMKEANISLDYSHPNWIDSLLLAGATEAAMCLTPDHWDGDLHQELEDTNLREILKQLVKDVWKIAQEAHTGSRQEQLNLLDSEFLLPDWVEKELHAMIMNACIMSRAMLYGDVHKGMWDLALDVWILAQENL